MDSGPSGSVLGCLAPRRLSPLRLRGVRVGFTQMPGPNVSQQNIPLWGGLSMFLLSESVVYCCDSSVFISVVLPACFHCPKVAKESKMFRFWYESCKSHVSGLLLLEAQLYFCVWLSWRRWCVSLVFLFEVLQERLCADSQMKSSVVNKPPLHY